MYLNIRSIIRILARLSVLIGICLILPAICGIICGEIRAAVCFACTALFLASAGLIILRLVKPSSASFRIRDGFLIVSAGWIFAIIAGAVPFVLSGDIPSFSSAIFESASGFTTTGSTASEPELLSHAAVFWRALSQWLGGLAFIISSIILFPAFGFEGQQSARAKIFASSEKFGGVLTPNIKDALIKISVSYAGLTLLEVIFLLAGRLSFFDALIHSFSTISTGGFTRYADGIGHFDSAYVQWVFIAFMFLAGMSYTLYIALLRRKPNAIKSDYESHVYTVYTFVIIILILLSLFITGGASIVNISAASVRGGILQAVSTVTTTGFSALPFGVWSSFALTLMLIVMIVGGCTASPSGGIKLLRAGTALGVIRREIIMRIHPNVYAPVKLKNKTLPADRMQFFTGFTVFYFVFITIAVLVLSAWGHGLLYSLTSVVAAVSNTGSGFTTAGPVVSYAAYSPFVKYLLSFLMVIGRLELFTVLLLFTPSYWNPDRC